MQQSAIHQQPWPLWKRFGFLFIALYFLLYLAEAFISSGLVPAFIAEGIGEVWFKLIQWTGAHILHIGYPITVRPNGSGDTTYNYVEVFLFATIAFIAALAWVLVGRRRKNFDGFAAWTRILMRYYLGFFLVTYGSVKIIKLQFPYPSLHSLLQSYGDSSPMGLAWNFLGYSEVYNWFTGAAEAMAGLLLFFRRTTLLGALLSFGVMLNVCIMNFTYDIPVKLFSAHLVLFSIYLIAHDRERLAHLFLFNRTAAPAPPELPQPVGWKRWLRIGLKVIFITYLLYASFWSSFESSKQYGDKAPKTPLYGIYNVTSFVRNGDTIPPLTTDTTRWKQLVLEWKTWVYVKTMNDSLQGMLFKLDTAQRLATFQNRDSSRVYQLRYERTDSSNLLLYGRMGTDSLRISTVRFDEKTFLLNSRGFHWINEYPFNR